MASCTGADSNGDTLRPPGSVEADALVIDMEQPGIAIDRRLFGTNVPAWLGPERLLDPAFQELTVQSGVTLLRMPGGSWSNAYDWLGCELGDESRCYWTWAARPSDFVEFLEATGLAGSWTVSANATAQEAAAAVAFFNGATTDDSVIGIDRNGTDWMTVAHWAELRAAGGHPEPVGIELWEFGNEVFGGRSGVHAECASFGWEDVWTCDGTEYALGDDDHDGYLAVREAMLAVDPTIRVGAVGVAEPSSWSNWGNEVIEAAGDSLDYYVVHQYGFDESPGVEQAVARPAQLWPGVVRALDATLAPLGADVAVTEYNLVSFIDGDTEAVMTTAANALFLADTIGQLALAGTPIANQWNLANGAADNGADYGLVDADTYERLPAFWALSAWERTGDRLLTVDPGDDDLRVYPTVRDDGSIAIVVLNLSDADTQLLVRLPTGPAVGNLWQSVAQEAAYAPHATDRTMTRESTGLEISDSGDVDLVLRSYSINVVETTP